MFELDKRLAADTLVVGNFELSTLLLSRDSRYPWCILVPKVAGISESYQLSDQQQIQLCKESSLVASELMTMFNGDSMNVAALGNVVSQLHVHHVVRFENDESWPGPIWGQGTAIGYQNTELEALKTKLVACFEGSLGFKVIV